MKPDYFLVLPWHFKDSIIRREQAFLASGGKLIFPCRRSRSSADERPLGYPPRAHRRVGHILDDAARRGRLRGDRAVLPPPDHPSGAEPVRADDVRRQWAPLLHVGCGSGQVDVDVRGTYDVLGSTSPGRAQPVSAERGPRREGSQGERDRLPFADQSVAGIYSLGLLEHFEEPDIQTILKEFHRVLAEGGKLLLLWPPRWGPTVMVLDTTHFIVNRVLRIPMKLHPDEVSLLRSRSHLERLIAGTGFGIEQFYFGPRDAFTHVICVLSQPTVGRRAETERARRISAGPRLASGQRAGPRSGDGEDAGFAARPSASRDLRPRACAGRRQPHGSGPSDLAVEVAFWTEVRAANRRSNDLEDSPMSPISPKARLARRTGRFPQLVDSRSGMNRAGSPRFRCAIRHGRRHRPRYPFYPKAGTVTLNPSAFSFGRPLLYVSTEASIPLAAALTGGTYAPRMASLPIGGDDSFASPVERLFIAVNGPSEPGCDNPRRQGLFVALTDGFRPNNVFGGIPTIALDYSPMPTCTSGRRRSTPATAPSSGRSSRSSASWSAASRKACRALGSARRASSSIARWFSACCESEGLVALALARGRVSAEPRAARAAGARLRPPSSRCRATIAASIPARP